MFSAGVIAVSVGTASASTPTKASWVRSANHICATELIRSHALPTPVADYLPEARHLDHLASIVSTATMRLSRLPRPPASQTAIRQWIALEWRGVKHIRQMAAAFRAHNLAAVKAIGAADKPRGVEADALALRLGAAVCAKS